MSKSPLRLHMESHKDDDVNFLVEKFKVTKQQVYAMKHTIEKAQSFKVRHPTVRRQQPRPRPRLEPIGMCLTIKQEGADIKVVYDKKMIGMVHIGVDGIKFIPPNAKKRPDAVVRYQMLNILHRIDE